MSIWQLFKKREWWETYPWHWWADLFFGTSADPAYNQTSQQIDFVEKVVPLQKGDKILDLACGNGRHAVELAKRGYIMTCFDYSRQMLARAREKAAKENVELKTQQGDMRKISWGGEFDVILCLFQSFGYFDRQEDDQKVLLKVFEALKNGGKFLLDVRNPDYIFGKIRNGENAVLKPFYSLANGGSVKIKEEVIEPKTWRVNFEWQINGKEVKNNWNDITLYNLDELTEMIEAVNFKVEKVWGDYTGEIYNRQTSKRIIILSQKI